MGLNLSTLRIKVMFSWLDTKESEAFGISLADYFMEKMPKDHKKLNDETKKRQIIKDMGYKASVFIAKNKMNFYKRSKLWNSFKWVLYNADYEKSYVDELTYSLVLMN